MPVDETRYAAVAWEMWSGNEYLVPHLNGETYSDKPPLLFWLMALSWRFIGVNDWSLRIISPLFSLASLILSCNVARALWPDRSKMVELTPMILLGLFVWIVSSTLTMFDMMLAFFVLLGIFTLVKLAYSGLSFRRWVLLGIAIGAGILSKGPAVLLHLLPVALLAPWWVSEKKADFLWIHWYGGLIASIFIGVLIALCWAIPAGISGGETYRNAIFFGQISGRLVKSFAHQFPWWWYLQMLPLLLLPWLLIKPLWTGLKKLTIKDSGFRFCLAWALPVFIAFSLISGKRLHYLLPLIPALALILARAADEETDCSAWKRAHLTVIAVYMLLGVALVLLPWLNKTYHWLPDVSLISPAWGGLLCLSTLILGMARAKNAQESVFYTCLASVIALIIISSSFFYVNDYRYDTRVAARQISALMAENREIAYYGSKYHGEYHFSGRLKQPITVISGLKVLKNWAQDHQSGYIIVPYKNSNAFSETIFSYHYPFRGQNIGLVSSKVLLNTPDIRPMLKL